jgi:hypothetical protein
MSVGWLMVAFTVGAGVEGAEPEPPPPQAPTVAAANPLNIMRADWIMLMLIKRPWPAGVIRRSRIAKAIMAVGLSAANAHWLLADVGRFPCAFSYELRPIQTS